MILGDEGIGEISDAEIAKRAVENARMDGRTEVSEADLVNARDDLRRTGPPGPPEEGGELGMIHNWQEPPGSVGHKVERVVPEDEDNLTEQLVNEGLEEADRDQRIASSEDLEEE